MWLVVLAGVLWLACSEEKGAEPASAESAPQPAAAKEKTTAESPPAGSSTNVPVAELAVLEEELQDIEERIDQLSDDSDAADAEAVGALRDERSRISKELEELRDSAGEDAGGEDWKEARERLEKAVAELEERVDGLEESEGSG